jgi:hypothetical protein
MKFGEPQSVEDGNGVFAALLKEVTIVSPVGACVAVGCMVTCGDIVMGFVKGPSGFELVASVVEVR